MTQKQKQDVILPLRKSGSLILLYPTNIDNQSQYDHQYKTMLLKRKSTMSFSNSYVFPGGVCQKQDKQIANSMQFQQYCKISAIRQFLQQTGLLIYPAVNSYFVQNRMFVFSSLQDMTTQLKLIWQGNLGYIQPIVRFLTPQQQTNKKRFDCLFYICRFNKNIRILNIQAIQQKLLNLNHIDSSKTIPFIQQYQNLANTKLLLNKDQSDDHVLATPQKLLQQYNASKIQLFPPQVIIIACLLTLCNKQNRKELLKFSSNPNTNYFNKIQPMMFTFDFYDRNLVVMGDKRYNYSRIIQREPESQSKNQLKQYFESVSPILYKQNVNGVRRIKLGQKTTLNSSFEDLQNAFIFKFFDKKQKINPKL